MVLLDFMPDLFYLGYVATMFFPVWTLLSRIFLFHHLDSFCMKLNDFEDWKEILGTGIVLVIGKDLQIWSDTLTYAILNKNRRCESWKNFLARPGNRTPITWVWSQDSTTELSCLWWKWGAKLLYIYYTNIFLDILAINKKQQI